MLGLPRHKFSILKVPSPHSLPAFQRQGPNFSLGNSYKYIWLKFATFTKFTQHFSFCDCHPHDNDWLFSTRPAGVKSIQKNARFKSFYVFVGSFRSTCRPRSHSAVDCQWLKVIRDGAVQRMKAIMAQIRINLADDTSDKSP